MPTYLAADRRKPWIVVFQADDMSEIAAAIAAQEVHTNFEIRASDRAGTRQLTSDEQQELADTLSR